MLLPVKNKLTNGGWRWLAWTGKAYHPGEDLNTGAGNSDIGEPVYFCGTGEVYKVAHSNKGYGNQVIQKLDDCFVRFAHLLPFELSEGVVVDPSVSILKLGKSGAAESAHLHWEVMTPELVAWLEQKRPKDWWNFYPNGYSKQWVQTMYRNPLTYDI